MAEHNEIGKQGEDHGVDHLRSKNYKIKETNWRSGKLEIDIIAEDPLGKQIVFFEVKTRKTNSLIEPEIAVDRNKQRNIVRAANKYMQMKNLELEARFDILAITHARGGMSINHLEDAFYATL